MKVKDLIEYCSIQDDCDICEYKCACDIYYGIHIPCLDVYRRYALALEEGGYFDTIEWYDSIDWNAEIKTDKEYKEDEE